MKLASYLAEHQISFSAFARQIGTPHGRTVERYARGKRIPSGLMMAAIVRVTEGAVQPADFVSEVSVPEVQVRKAA